MSRKAFIVLVAIFGLCAGLAAQNEAFLGIWELNLTKSSITRGAPPRSETTYGIPQQRFTSKPMGRTESRKRRCMLPGGVR